MLAAVKVGAVVAILLGLAWVVSEVSVAIKHAGEAKVEQKQAAIPTVLTPTVDKPRDQGFLRRDIPAWKPAPRPATASPITVYIPPTPAAAKEIEAKLGVDLAASDVVTRFDVPKAPWGGDLAVTVPKAGGAASSHFLANSRPRLSFRPVLEIGAGPVVAWQGAPPNYGALVTVDLSVLRVGNWRLRLHGDAAMLPTAQDHLQGRGAVLATYRWGADE
jgi:hypothetical protein